MQSLLIGIQEEVFAIPLSSVIESIRIKPSEIQHVGDTEVIKLRNSVLPLWYRHPDLEEMSKIARKRQTKRSERMFVVVVGSAERRFGLVVDTLLNQQEMVIKPMGPLMRGTPCVAGGAVMGDGDVVLVLDVPEIENYFRTKMRQAQHAAA